MTEKLISAEEKKNIISKAKTESKEACSSDNEKTVVTTFQQQIGNRAIQRVLAQRNSESLIQLDDDTTARINHERSGGQALESNIQAKMSEATGQDFSDVKVHTSLESHALNEQLSAKAFTTGSDIFFREGAYDPGSSGGQELLAHEMAHVVQQRAGAVGGGGGKMTVNAPGDAFEQQADSVAKAVTGPAAAPSVQRQMPEEEDEVQAKAIQRQEVPDEDETLQRQELNEDEEELNAR
jgi:hypothetical protein